MEYIRVITHLLTIDPNFLGHPNCFFFNDRWRAMVASHWQGVTVGFFSCIYKSWSGQITPVIFAGITLVNHQLGWPTGGKGRYNLPRLILLSVVFLLLLDTRIPFNWNKPPYFFEETTSTQPKAKGWEKIQKPSSL